MHLAHVLSVCVFPGNRTHNLCAANTMLYHWATGTQHLPYVLLTTSPWLCGPNSWVLNNKYGWCVNVLILVTMHMNDLFFQFSLNHFQGGQRRELCIKFSFQKSKANAVFDDKTPLKVQSTLLCVFSSPHTLIATAELENRNLWFPFRSSKVGVN